MSAFNQPISEQIWDQKYRMKDQAGNPIDQTVDDTWMRVATALAAVEDSKAAQERQRLRFFELLASGQFLPAGRIIAGAGTGRNVTLSNCFTMGTIPDSMEGIFQNLKEAALTMQAGGGIGYDFSTLRPKGSPVIGVAADASGPLTFMDVWDAMCRTVMSAGSRRGAMMATMRVDHPDIEDFITAKSDPKRLRMFNLSVLITDEFMQAVKDEKEWRLHFENRRGETIAEKTVDAKELWEKIMKATYAYAEPGVIFIDRVNQDHNLGYLETIATTNPCGEKPMGPYASCLLGSINLAKFVIEPFKGLKRVSKSKVGALEGIDIHGLRQAVRVAIRMMDNVIEASLFPLEEQREKARSDRQLGLGVTGLADMLIMLGIKYGSLKAASLTKAIMQIIAESAYAASIELAQLRGSFPSFNADEFLAPERFAGRMLSEEMKADIRTKGIRNGLLISIAPTGTISLFAGNISSGIEPVFAFEYTRKVLNPDGSHRFERVVDAAVLEYEKLYGENAPKPDYFVTTADLSPDHHIRMQAAAQRWVDSSISKTVNLPEDITFEDFMDVYEWAYESGCKGCTTYRPNEITGSILSITPKPAESDAVLPASTPEGDSAPTDSGPGTIAHTASLVVPPKPDTEVTAILDVSVDFTETERRISLPEAIGLPYTGGTVTGRWDGSNKPGAFVRRDSIAEDREFLEKVMDDRNWTRLAARDQMIHAKDEPAVRSDELDGKTYKLKFGADEHALYVTINDLLENGQRRPFEVFVNSKNMQHYAWTVALTRMISAIFRRPHDSRFVVEELKAVFDPSGGAFHKGTFVPSVVAAIGGVIEKHMKAIGYMEHGPAGPFRPIGDVAKTVVEKVAFNTPMSDVANKVVPPHVQSRGVFCPKCFSSNYKHESGCSTCMDCGHSKCS